MDIVSALESALEMSHAFAKLVRAGMWQEASALELQRTAVLRASLASLSGALQAEQAEAVLEAIRRIDNDLMYFVGDQLKAHAVAGQDMQRGRIVSDRYKAVAAS